MLTKWSAQLLTGNEIIDKQHLEIFEYVDQIVDSERSGKIEKETGKIIEYLESYFQRHFADEEDLQIKYRFPGYKVHREMHQAFREDLSELKHKFVLYGASHKLVNETVLFMVEWLAKHIHTSDKILALYIQNAQSDKSTPVTRPGKS
ncbi:MAG TPA: hemerythrin family protein [Terriglobales bacterium]|nr:hemerythrin family protein [Terriglobales bacterium]